jgi:hypothetical protein
MATTITAMRIVAATEKGFDKAHNILLKKTSGDIFVKALTAIGARPNILKFI